MGIHFFIDDYQFERIWKTPFSYIEMLRKFDCVLTPDFSLYTDMPLALQVWNVYRSRLIGQVMQDMGLDVIPTVSWGNEKTFNFCFDGLPEGGVMAVSTIGVKRRKEAGEIYRKGIAELIKHKSPEVLLVYGGEFEADYGNAKLLHFKNEVTERLKNGR